MTNEQLAALLESYLRRLEGIVDALDDGLPVGIPRHIEYWNPETNLRMSPEFAVFTKKEYEERETGYAICLDDLREFLDQLEETIESLHSRPIPEVSND